MSIPGTDFLGGCTPPEMICPPRNDLHPPQRHFAPPANYIYFDLIVSYLIILTAKFVKLPILWSQISPCRPRKQILFNFFLGLSGRCHHAPAKASSSTPPYIYPPPRTKIWKSVSGAYHAISSIVMSMLIYTRKSCGMLISRLMNILQDFGISVSTLIYTRKSCSICSLQVHILQILLHILKFGILYILLWL
jgi:hypothetical protein